MVYRGSTQDYTRSGTATRVPNHNFGKHLQRFMIPAEVIEQCWQGDQDYYSLDDLSRIFGMSRDKTYRMAKRCGWLLPEYLQTAKGYRVMDEEEFRDWWKIRRGGAGNYKQLAEEIGVHSDSLLLRLRRYGIDTSWAPRRGRPKEELW